MSIDFDTGTAIKSKTKLVWWPSPQDYNEAIQTPRLCFADAELRAGTLDVSPLGLPRPITGNFASVYMLQTSNRKLAVRCAIVWSSRRSCERPMTALISVLRTLKPGQAKMNSGLRSS